MRGLSSFFYILLVGVSITYGLEETEADRNEKLISTFQIVRFPNDMCVGTNSRNGTCYTSAECSDKSGTSSGSCADGFGVCCTFVINTCGSSSSENNTYWTSPTTITEGDSCDLTICPMSSDICQIRLDLTTFVITGPSIASLSQVRRAGGMATGALADTAGVLHGSNYATNCLHDTFSVSGVSPSASPPQICGTNSGYHLYVEANVNDCNRLRFSLGDDVHSSYLFTNSRGTISEATRSWDITAQQIECTSITLPPNGCTQYFWGSGIATLQSFNWRSSPSATPTSFAGVHLAQQHQRFCIRRERGNCVGCFSGAAIDFQVSGQPLTVETYTMAGGCCGYAAQASEGLVASVAAIADNFFTGANGSSQLGWDCVIIPGAFQQGTVAGIFDATQTAAEHVQTLLSTTVPLPVGPHFCGHGAGLGTGGTTTAITSFADEAAVGTAVNISICTRRVPFTLEFLSDDLEGLGSSANDTEFSDGFSQANQGFSLTHRQIACA